MRIFLAFFLASCLSVLPIAASQAQDTLRPAAVVNDEVISMLDLSMRLRLSILAAGLEDTPETRQRLLQQVLRQLIDERLQVQEADRLDFQVGQEEVNQAIAEIAGRQQMQPDVFVQRLQRSGVLPTVFIERIKAGLIWRALVSRRMQSTNPVGPEDVEQEVLRQEDLLNDPRYRVFEIFLPFDNAREENEAQQVANRLIEQLRQGADFRSIARQFSQSATASAGGDLGLLTLEDLPTELVDVVQRLQTGSIAGPVRAINGYYIVLLRNVRQPSPAREEERVRLTQVLLDTPEGQEQTVTAEAARLAGEIRSCGQAEGIIAERGAEGSGNLGERSVEALSENIRTAVDGLQVGQASAPLTINGKIGFVVLCLREGGASRIDRNRVQQRLESERMQVTAERYMRDLRRSANIDIRI